MKINLKITAISAIFVLTSISAMFTSAEETFHHGDVNGDNLVDAVDASLILSNYAAASTNAPLLFDEVQLELADTNGDGQVDASDSSMVLGYYAYIATDGTMTPEEYYLNALSGKNDTSDAPVTTISSTDPTSTSPTTTIAPQGMGVQGDTFVVELPDPTTEPDTQPAETEPPVVVDPVTEPEIVHGEGCQYIHYDCVWCCEDGNDGYPAHYTDEDKENFKYAFNEALKYTDEANAVGWGYKYVACLVGRDKSEVFIGDPTDGDAYPTVWCLKGYTEDGDEIWYHAR